MRDRVRQVIARYGSDVTVHNAQGDVETRAFVQLVTSKSWQNMERMLCTGGEIPRGQFLFILPPEVPVEAADEITFDERVFVVRRADAIVYHNVRLFTWGLCVEGGEADPWAT